MQYLGIDWGTRRAAWCALSEGGELSEGKIAADADGLARLVARLGPDVRGWIEMMSGAAWHVLALKQPFKPSATRATEPAPASSSIRLAA